MQIGVVGNHTMIAGTEGESFVVEAQTCLAEAATATLGNLDEATCRRINIRCEFVTLGKVTFQIDSERHGEHIRCGVYAYRIAEREVERNKECVETCFGSDVEVVVNTHTGVYIKGWTCSEREEGCADIGVTLKLDISVLCACRDCEHCAHHH